MKLLSNQHEQGCCMLITLFIFYREWLIKKNIIKHPCFQAIILFQASLEGAGDLVMGGIISSSKYADDLHNVLLVKKEEILHDMMHRLTEIGTKEWK